jgi:hypothetical protein
MLSRTEIVVVNVFFLKVWFRLARRSTSHRSAPRHSRWPGLAGGPERIRAEDHIWLVIGLLWGGRGTLPACSCQGLLFILRNYTLAKFKCLISEIRGPIRVAASANHRCSGCCVMKNEDPRIDSDTESAPASCAISGALFCIYGACAWLISVLFV